MLGIDNFLKLRVYNEKETTIFKKIRDKYNFQILVSTKNNIYKNVFGSKVIKGITKKETADFLSEYKEYLMDILVKEENITKFSAEQILEIERKNKLDKYSLLEYKTFYKNKFHKKIDKKYSGLWSKALRETYKNQIFKDKLNFSDKEKIYVNCCIESYHFSQKNNNFRPKSFVDPKTNTIYEYLENISDINKSVWLNTEKNIFGKNTVIIAYRGTGVSESLKKFSITGYKKRDFKLDSLIAKGKLYNSKELKKVIEDFLKIYKNFGKSYNFYITGHSLGGRLAFEIHREEYRKIKECRIFNPAFSYDDKYLKDVIKAHKKDYPWKKNIYNYHIGGILKEPEDNDIISVLSGGYGKSYTYYKNFKQYHAGHNILNFVEKIKDI